MSNRKDIPLDRAAAEYVLLAREVIGNLQKEADDKQEEIDELRSKVDGLVSDNGRKTASVERPKEVFNETDLQNTVESLKELGYVDAAETEKVARDIQGNPGRLLVFTDKIASMQKVPDMGLGSTAEDEEGGQPSSGRDNTMPSDRRWEKLFVK